MSTFSINLLYIFYTIDLWFISRNEIFRSYTLNLHPDILKLNFLPELIEKMTTMNNVKISYFNRKDRIITTLQAFNDERWGGKLWKQNVHVP